MVSRLEALVDSIGRLNGCHSPESEAYQLRSPLLLCSYARAGKHEIDEQGRRIFDSLLSGYRAAIYDLELKLSGQSRAGLKKGDTLLNLLGCYGIKELGAISNVVSFLRRALKDQSVDKTTKLEYFLS